jgi:hypothetical protein
MHAPGATPGYSWGYWQPPRPQGPNSLAVASFVISFFGFTGLGIILSVVFGVLALVRLRDRPQQGKGLAIAGLVISGTWLALLALVIGLAAANGPQQTEAGGNGGGHGSVNVFDLRTGQCFHNPSAGETLFGVTYVSVLPCTVPHNAQVFVQFRAAGTGYPGHTGLKQQADRGCRARLRGNIDHSKITGGMGLRFLFPQQASWGKGEHTITCFIVSTRRAMTASLLPSDTTG